MPKGGGDDAMTGCIIVFFVAIFVGLGVWKLVDLIILGIHHAQ